MWTHWRTPLASMKAFIGGRQCVGRGRVSSGPSVLRQREGGSSKQGVLHAGHSSVISECVIVLSINYRNKKN